MALSAGSQLGPYEILTLLDEGGMGQVYRAKDTRLDRIVAIKVLHPHIAKDTSARERFEREAKTVSALDHPHICTLFDVGEQEGVAFLVMEFLEGETLADRLRKGALPLEKALLVATQLADGLDAGHRAGVVHRDFKPGNVMLTSQGVKIMDYGLAKIGTPATQSGQDLSAWPTAAKPLTEKGAILGTFQYMAPEQLEAKSADARTDIFAFGAVLYEMLTGRRAFEGKSQASLISAIMKDDPPVISTLQPMLPSALDHVVKTCLAKEPDQRWQSAGDVKRELTWIAESGSDAGMPAAARPRSQTYFAWGLALVFAVVVAGMAAWNLKPPPLRPVTRLSLTLPPGAQFTTRRRHLVALSPNGAHIVYIANRQLYLRAMDQIEATPMRGTEGRVTNPFFSPDGQWVGFYAGGQLRKVSISGGAAVTLCEASNPYGASWGVDDTIVFGQHGEGILQVSAAGGTPEVLVPMSANEGLAHGPQMLPDGKSLLFTIGDGSNWDDAQIVVQSWTTGERLVLIEGGRDARYVPTGHLVYALRGTLLAVPFDAARLEVTGGPVSLIEGVATAGVHSGAAHFSVSDTGSMVYVDAFENETARTFVWVDREGREERLEAEPRAYRYPRISPDGTRVALDIRDQELDTWIWDFARETLTRLTFDVGWDEYALWTPDGRRIVFSSPRGGAVNLFWKAADGTGAAERLTDSPNRQYPHTFSLDGKQLVFREITADRGADLRVLSLEGERSTKALLATEYNEINGELSPDGRWLAYQSNESGEDDIYVRPFPNASKGRWQISTGGGEKPLWGPDGRELFYMTPSGRLMVVPLQTDPSFATGSAEFLFVETYHVRDEGRTYDISPDGQRFLMIKESKDDSSAPRSMTVVLNWFEELKARVPTGK
jgi:serine/threonine-protein kinase